jgi:hypothetical protein
MYRRLLPGMRRGEVFPRRWYESRHFVKGKERKKRANGVKLFITYTILARPIDVPNVGCARAIVTPEQADFGGALPARQCMVTKLFPHQTQKQTRLHSPRVLAHTSQSAYP